MKILLVDDSGPFLEAIGAILAEVGYRDVVTRTSAESALRYLRAEGAAVDLVLMDLVMPGMDGIAAVRAIQSDRALRDIPIVMVSGQDNEIQIERAFEAGATDYIGKPPKKIELRARVRSALKLKRERERRKSHQRELELLNRSLAAANIDLARLSRIDALTGVPNRRSFDDLMRREWLRAQRDGRPLSLVLVDVDCFKTYNDHYGHLAGDTCLRRVAEGLTAALKRGGDYLARYGGEEFAAVLPGTEADGAVRVAEEMRRCVEALGLPHARSVVGPRVTVTAGVCSVVPEEGWSSDALIHATDRALYDAKGQGRNRVGVGRINPLEAEEQTA